MIKKKNEVFLKNTMNFKVAFTIAELVVTILVLAFLVFVLLGFMSRDQQKEFDAKNDKTVANIHALIDKASVKQTGNLIANDDVISIQNIVTSDSGLNITDPNCGLACWGADENETPGAAAGRHILLNDQTSIAFAQSSGKIYIDANGANAPNRLGRDIRELDYANIPTTPGTIASCQFPRVIHDSLCCPPKNADELWKKGCDRCKRIDSELGINREWAGNEGDDDACTPKCKAGFPKMRDSKTCCPSLPDGTKTRWEEASGCKICNVSNVYVYAKWINDAYGCDTECRGDRPIKNDATKWCCPSKPNGTTQRWTGTECGICSLDANEIWISTTGCDKCAKNKWRNNTCCSTTNNSNPSNSKMNTNDCGYTCTTSTNNTTYIASNHGNGNISVGQPSSSNSCTYSYACSSGIAITDSTLISRLTYCLSKNGNDSSKCGPHAYQDGRSISTSNFGDLYYLELNNGRKDFFAHTVQGDTNWYRSYTNTSNGTSVSAFNSLQNVSSYVNSYDSAGNNAYKVSSFIYNKNSGIAAVCLNKAKISGKFCYSPLSFDLDGNGVTTKDEAIEYDINGDGSLDAINDSADAVLCFDRDKDGVCGKDGSELFGDNTRFGFEDENFEGYADGFDALRALAEHEGLISENDNKLDENDIKYLEDKWGLRIKKDGYLSEGEKLTDNKITEISTNDGKKHWYENFDEKGNNLMVQDGATFVIDNKTNIFADIWHTITNAISGVVNAITGIFK